MDIAVVYEELRRLAHHYMRGEREGHTLQTTALVNEAYLRLVGVERMQWRDRRHSSPLAATLMRRILVDHARERAAGKRSGGLITSLDDSPVAPQRDIDLLALDEALTRLAALDPQQERRR